MFVFILPLLALTTNGRIKKFYHQNRISSALIVSEFSKVTKMPQIYLLFAHNFVSTRPIFHKMENSSQLCKSVKSTSINSYPWNRRTKTITTMSDLPPPSRN